MLGVARIGGSWVFRDPNRQSLFINNSFHGMWVTGTLISLFTYVDSVTRTSPLECTRGRRPIDPEPGHSLEFVGAVLASTRSRAAHHLLPSHSRLPTCL